MCTSCVYSVNNFLELLPLLIVLLPLQGSIVVGIAHDCKENRVYWTDLSARTINRATMAPGAEPEVLINTSNDSHLHSASSRIAVVGVFKLAQSLHGFCSV